MKPIKLSVKLLAFGLILILLLVGVVRLGSGRSLGLRGFLANLPQQAVSKSKAILAHANIQRANQGNYTNIIFLHHSVGQGIIAQGSLRERLSQAGFLFYDHDYNTPGLTTPEGEPAGYDYSVPDDNTDPNGLARIFQQPIYPLPFNTLSGLFQHEVIIVKSCFPNSHIDSDQKMSELQAYYQEIREVMRQHPEKVFILLTSPPLNPAETNLREAGKAQQISSWLGSEQFQDGAANIFVFDLFHLLIDPDATSPEFNMLRADYRNGPDSHPNQKANETIGPLLADFIQAAVQEYRQVRAAQ